jgi:hypothetical protein
VEAKGKRAKAKGNVCVLKKKSEGIHRQDPLTAVFGLAPQIEVPKPAAAARKVSEIISCRGPSLSSFPFDLFPSFPLRRGYSRAAR